MINERGLISELNSDWNLGLYANNIYNLMKKLRTMSDERIKDISYHWLVEYYYKYYKLNSNETVTRSTEQRDIEEKHNLINFHEGGI